MGRMRRGRIIKKRSSDCVGVERREEEDEINIKKAEREEEIKGTKRRKSK
jgi:hypothetical protein